MAWVQRAVAALSMPQTSLDSLFGQMALEQGRATFQIPLGRGQGVYMEKAALWHQQKPVLGTFHAWPRDVAVTAVGGQPEVANGILQLASRLGASSGGKC